MHMTQFHLQANKVAAEIDAEKAAEAADSTGSTTPSKVNSSQYNFRKLRQ